MPRIDHVNQRFGRLIVLHADSDLLLPSGQRCKRWFAACDCGNTAVVHGSHLRSGATRSCGCLEQESRDALRIKHGHAFSGAWSPEYKAWRAMLQRCYQKSSPRYARYGGRGITVCDRWRRDFSQFFRDMGPKPNPQYQIDRIDNDADYSPENCRWVSPAEQAKNRSNSLRLTLHGVTMRLTEWADQMGVPSSALRSRVSKGWTDERVLTQPFKRRD